MHIFLRARYPCTPSTFKFQGGITAQAIGERVQDHRRFLGALSGSGANRHSVGVLLIAHPPECRNQGGAKLRFFWYRGGCERERQTRSRALCASRPPAVGYTGGCDPEEGVIECHPHSGLRRYLRVRRTQQLVRLFVLICRNLQMTLRYGLP